MGGRTSLVVIFGFLLAGCSVGPNYHRPAMAIPEVFRAPTPLSARQAESVADLKWFEVFKDEQLQTLIRTALAQNYDLRDAVARIDAARFTHVSDARVESLAELVVAQVMRA